MDAQVIGQLIATLGFPIVAAAAMFWMVNKNEERHNNHIIRINSIRKGGIY